MRTRIAAVAAALLAAALAGCTSGETDGGLKPDPKASATTNIETPAMSDKERQEARDKAREAAGLPPEPKGAARQAFLDGLNAIDPDIVHGKDDKAISRGIDTCGILKRFPGDRAKQIDQTEKRWSSPTHPDGHGLATAERILDVAHKHICPKF